MSRTCAFFLAVFIMALPFRPAASQEVKKKADDPMKKGITFLYQQKYEMAEMMFQEEIKRNPDNAKAWSYLGDISLVNRKYDGAMDCYRKALDLNPSSAEDRFRMGQVYYHKNLGTQAIDSFKKAYELNPGIKYSLYHIGLAYLMLQRDKENTIRNWERYLSIAPEDPQYDKIRRVIDLLRDPNFVIPPVGSDISIEEALQLGGAVLKGKDLQAEEKKAGHEDKKTKQKMEDIYRDDLNN